VSTLVVQSSPARVQAWVERCMASVRGWASARGYEYEHLGDELLDLAPGWVHDAAGSSLLPVTDVARLELIRRRLAEGRSRVVWLDADVCVFDPPCIDLESDADVAVCVERWVTGAPGGGLQAAPCVNNAALSVRQVDALLEATLARARAGDALGARALGPDLLTPMHRAAPFGEITGISVASPHVVRGAPAAWDVLVGSLPWPVGALNLCWSMAADDGGVDRFVDALLTGAYPRR
jgi:hypothetical protein